MRAVALGCPSFFRIKSGSNPHTRNRWGFRKRVDLSRALAQWKRFKDQLEDLELHVFVIPPQKEWPGMVFPANAGVVIDREIDKPFCEKFFLMSRLIPGRAGEGHYYRPFLENLGFQIREIPFSFEGEADFFPAGPYWMMTYGKIIRQCYQFKWGLPPYKRVYGFRTDVHMLEVLCSEFKNLQILDIELIDERFYHGDTALCAFGPALKFLLAYLPGISKKGQGLLKTSFHDNLISLSAEDGIAYAANSFYAETNTGKFLLMPKGVSMQLKEQIKERDVTPIEVDVSEFFEKGGGSVKCMILDLGPYQT